jgi:hypothetical protein
MIAGEPYPDNDAGVAHWALVETSPATSRISGDGRGRYFVLSNRLDLTPEQRSLVQQAARETPFDPFALASWAEAAIPNYGIYASVVRLSEDYGATWRDLARVGSDGVDILLAPDGDVYVATGHGVVRSTDDGQTFEAFGLDAQLIEELSADDAGNVYAYASGDGLYRAPLGSAEWQRLDVEYGGSRSPVQHRADWNDGVIAVWGNDSSLPVSTDNGQTWTTRFLPADTDVLARAGEQFYVLGADQTLFHSPDAGESWDALSLPPTTNPILDLMLGVHGELFALTIAGAFVSSDNGRTWQKERGLHEALSADVAWEDSGRGIVACERGLLRYHAAP